MFENNFILKNMYETSKNEDFERSYEIKAQNFGKK